MDAGRPSEVAFFPVLHLMTGPPKLLRNGGIWKGIKAGLRLVSDPPRLMVQALHFVPYDLSPKSWEEWFPSDVDKSTLASELANVFGPKRDVFVDSGGFQLLHAQKIDLSRWGLRLRQEDIFQIQSRYRAQRIANLDSPLPPAAGDEIVSALSRRSLANAVWLAENFASSSHVARPYLVVHGRTTGEVAAYLRRLETLLPSRWLRAEDYGIALGSQVPLSGRPDAVISNIRAVLSWMKSACSETADLHIFGVGDGIIGELRRGQANSDRPISYDNSTYVQKAFRLKIYDPAKTSYVDLDPTHMPRCSCSACGQLRALGSNQLAGVLSSPAYSSYTIKGRGWFKSDILGLVALHNLSRWKDRLSEVPPHRPINVISVKSHSRLNASTDYIFPLPRFSPRSPSLLLLQCSKWRPYSESRAHQKIKTLLSAHSLEEGRDFDRITLSGLYGPIHWSDEGAPAILGYDFPLTPQVSKAHIQKLRFRTATVLGVIGRRYKRTAAYLSNPSYSGAFGAVLRPFGVQIVDRPENLPAALHP